ncbi:MAG TPA: isoprenyl transferase [Opitutales bacterium]|nr:isoprenyl transferase [Opitutales bacterium]
MADTPPVNPANPRHVAIIMDGNGRWARQRGLPRIEGHRQGVENVRRIMSAARELGLPCLTLYAFSAENWRRPAEEVGALMGLLEFFLERCTRELIENEVRLRVIGQISQLPERARRPLESAVARTAHFTERTLVLALNYGSRQETVEAARAYAEAVKAGRENPAELDWPRFARYLDTNGLPDPDLIIRTSGESRLSNFLLLQAAYAEMYFSPVYWPDFSREHLIEAIEAYKQRERRFGQTGEQVRPTAPEPVLHK